MGLNKANSTEFDNQTPYPVISLLEEQEGIDYMGGTMRLGNYESKILPNTLIHNAYKKLKLIERHRHRYEFNNYFKDEFIKNGLKISCITDNTLIEGIEWTNHPYGIGVQFHPEFKSKPFNAHPLFREFIKASIKKRKK